MDYFAGLDVSVKETSVCIVDDAGKIVREARVASEHEALLQMLTNNRLARVGLEAGPLSQWLYSVLAEAGLPVICVETRHMRAVLKAQINKTDRNDARGIAQMMRVGLYRPVHVKTLRSQKLRVLLTHRKLLQSKAIAIENAEIRWLALRQQGYGAQRLHCVDEVPVLCERLFRPVYLREQGFFAKLGCGTGDSALISRRSEKKLQKNQALTSRPCFLAEQGLQRQRGGCQLNGTGKVLAKNRRCVLVEGHLEGIGPAFVIPNRPLPHSLLAPCGLRQIRLASTYARTDTIAVNWF